MALTVVVWLLNILAAIGVFGGGAMWFAACKYGLRGKVEGYEGTANFFLIAGAALLIIRLVIEACAKHWF